MLLPFLQNEDDVEKFVGGRIRTVGLGAQGPEATDLPSAATTSFFLLGVNLTLRRPELDEKPSK